MLPFSEWLYQAELLSEGQTRRVQHVCGVGNTLIVEHTYKGYSAYCFRCGTNGFKAHGMRTLDQLKASKEARDYATSQCNRVELALPHDFRGDIPTIGRLWYWRAGIPDSLAKLYGFGWSEAQQRVVIPVRDSGGDHLVYVQSRAVRPGQQPKYLNIKAAGRTGVGFYSDNRTLGYYQRPREWVADAPCKASPGTRIIVCEDILSSIRVGLSCPSSSILGTKLDEAFAHKLKAYERVTFWLDGDRAGIKGRVSGMRSLQLVHTGQVDYINSPCDPKDYSQQEIERWLKL